MSRMAILGLLVCSVVLVTSSGCRHGSSVTIGHGGEPHASHGKGHGPPPHAPAHGYRHKQHHRGGSDVDLVFDSGLGVYVVVGLPNTFYWNGYYLRIDNGKWFASAQLGGDWEARSSRSLPPGLRKKYAKQKGKKKGHAPAKGRW